MASNKGTMKFYSKPKMLVLALLIVNIADLCQSKAFLEEADKDRGKRLYSQQQSAGPHQMYDPQVNAEHWMTGNFYRPQVDGQPIYVPALDQPGSYNEFLDAYYKTYTPAWNLPTPGPPTYQTKNSYQKPETSEKKEGSYQKDSNYYIPTSKESELKTEVKPSAYKNPEFDFASELEEYDAPEIMDETIKSKSSNKNHQVPTPKVIIPGEYEESVERSLKKKSESPKTKPSDDAYYEPVAVKKKVPKPSISKTKPQLENPTDYEKPVVKTVEQKPKITNGKKDVYKPSVSKKEQWEDTDDYEEPVIVKTVKQKPKITNGKKDVYKPTVSKKDKQWEDTDYYEEPVIIKTIKQKPKINNGNKDVYKPSVSKNEPQLEDIDAYEEPVIVRTVKRKTNNEKKGISEKPYVSKNEPQLDADNYEKPVQKTVKTKPKRKLTNQTSKYNTRPTQANRKKSKGKRRKQYSKPNPKTGEVDILDPNTVEVSGQLSKKGEKYPSNDKEKGVVKTNPKEKTVVKSDQQYESVKTNPKAKTVVKSDQQYESVKTNEKVDINKPVKTNTQYMPVKINEKVPVQDSKNKPMETYPSYEPVKTKEKVAVKPGSKNPPTKMTVKYETGELETAKEVVSRKKSDSENDFDYTDMENGISKDKVDNSDKPNSVENDQNLETPKSSVAEKSDLNFPNINDFRGLSSMNSNIWSMLFNPNAEQNRLKLKRCITRSNETGFCTYIQNCEVPQIATSLEQLLNNACVIDDIFIGVCCPEFPVESVKVHWDQTLSDFDNQIEDEFGNNVEDCGIRSNEALELQSWPWKAPLVSMSNGKIFCGGVLVSEDHVLTAAHCTTKIPKNQILVRLGQYDDSSGDDYAVVEIKRHAQYNSRTMHNDVALLKLGRRVMNNAHIGIACLPDDEDNDHEGETATLLGWRGIFGTKSRDPEFLKVISNKDCQNRLGMKVPNTLLCTDTRKESERTCNADSGAPLVIEDDGKYEVIGILAWNRNDCNRRFPSTFSRVSSYVKWIKNHLA